MKLNKLLQVPIMLHGKDIELDAAFRLINRHANDSFRIHFSDDTSTKHHSGTYFTWGLSTLCLVVALLTIFYTYPLLSTNVEKQYLAIATLNDLPEESIIRPIPSATPTQIVESVQVTKETPDEYRYSVVSGDNRFRLTKRAAKQYILDNNLDYSERQINYAVTLIVSQHEGEKLRVGSILVIPVSELQTALDSN